MGSTPFVAKCIAATCDKLGLEYYLEESFGHVGYVQFPSKRRLYFSGTSLDINGLGASKIAKDKSYTLDLLAREGLRVPESILVLHPNCRNSLARNTKLDCSSLSDWDSVESFVSEHGFPVIVKPNEESCGVGVKKAHNRNDLYSSIYDLFSSHDRIQLQRFVAGNDYRAVVLKGEVVAAYQRRPLEIVGDGKNSVQTLISDTIRACSAAGQARGSPPIDASIFDYVSSEGYDLEEILAVDEIVPLLPNANLSMGGKCVDVTGKTGQQFNEIATKAASAVGLTFSGVDIICDTHDMHLSSYALIEVNSAPSLKMFAELGKDTGSRALAIYEDIITSF